VRVANWLQRLTKEAQHKWFMEDPGTGKPIWQVHLDTFFQTMKEEAPELMGEQWNAQTTDYARHQGNRAVFEQWLRHVPSELKMGRDLDPGFKEMVRQYLLQTQDFDPYGLEESSEDTVIPSSDELNEWWH